MKTTKSMVVFFATFVLSYLTLSSVGCLFFKSDLTHYCYSEILGNPSWAVLYTLFLGWWIAGIIAHEYYDEQCRKDRQF